ncbi:MAG: putative membrane protein YfhO, partial [Flavobacteriales bacterium]
ATKTPQLVVFSEVYYSKGWNAYINGKPVEHIRVNYLLRGLKVPKGYSKIEFKFEPSVVKTGSSIALFSSVLFLLILLGTFRYYYKEGKKGNI